MSENLMKNEAADLGAAVVLFVVGCGIGYLCGNSFDVMENLFSVPVVATVAGGELGLRGIKHYMNSKHQ